MLNDKFGGLKTDELLTQAAETEEKKEALREQRDKLNTELFNLSQLGTDAASEMERRRMELIGAGMWHFFAELGRTVELEAIAIRYVIDVLYEGKIDSPAGEVALLGLPKYEAPKLPDFNTLKRLKTLLQMGMEPPKIETEVAKQKRADQFAELFPDMLEMVSVAFDDDDDDDEDTL
jgi:hypothetical protein